MTRKTGISLSIKTRNTVISTLQWTSSLHPHQQAPFISSGSSNVKHISPIRGDISFINDIHGACTDIPGFHTSVGNIRKPTGYTTDHSDLGLNSKLHISIAQH